MHQLSLDVKKTKALLVGVSEYTSLDPIQPALGNIDDLFQLLTDEQLLGLPPENIVKIVNKKNDEIEEEILEFLDDAANVDFETLLFYYVGHGIRDSAANKALYLTGVNSKKKTLSTSSIPYNLIKNHIERSNWRQRIVILDACHSGLATMGEEDKRFTEDEIDIKGTYVLTSAGDEKSFFDTHARHTFFSGELIKLLRAGLPQQQPCLSLDDIFQHLEKNLKQSTPKRKSNFNVRDFFLFRNRQFDEAALLSAQAAQLFEEGKYEEAIKKYKEALAELTLLRHSDQTRIDSIRESIKNAGLYQTIKVKLVVGFEKAFAIKTSEQQIRIDELEAAHGQLVLKLKNTVSLTDYEALKKQKIEIEKALAQMKQDLQKALTQITRLEQENKQLKKERLSSYNQPIKDAPKGKDFTEKIGPVTFDMVFIKGGTFQMGSNENDAKKPIHAVTLADFYMGKHPVTVAEYLRFCKETNANWPEWLEKGSQYNINTGTDEHYKKIGDALQTPNHPIVGVSWTDALAYCKWLSQQTGKNYQLPTEAQWEYAAGGGATNRTKWAGTNEEKELAKYAWFDKNSGGKTHPVGTLSPNPLGIYDLSGNVWEWCNDWYGAYPTGAQTNPQGPASGSSRVNRGGGWYNLAGNCRVANRDSYSPDHRGNNLGFRLVFVP